MCDREIIVCVRWCVGWRGREREREREREGGKQQFLSFKCVFENVIIFIYVYVCVMVCCRMEGEERERGEKRKRLYGYTPSHLYISPFVEEDMKDNVRCYERQRSLLFYTVGSSLVVVLRNELKSS